MEMNPSDLESREEDFSMWGVAAPTDSLFPTSEILQQYFISSVDEQLLQTPLTNLLSDLYPLSSGTHTSEDSSQSSSQESPQNSPQDTVRPNSRFTKWLSVSGSSTSINKEKGKCTRKQMLGWINDKFQIAWQAQKMNSKLKHTSSSDSAPVPPPLLQQKSQKGQSSQTPLGAQNSYPDLAEAPLLSSNSKSSSHNHMIAERNRRSREKELKTVLMSCIPAGTMKKKDKNSVYQYAIDYIKQLQDQIGVLQQQNKETQQQASSSLEEEVNKSSDSSSFSMMVQEDHGSSLTLSFDTSSCGKMLPSLSSIIDMLNGLKGMGLEVDSFNWKPETSPILGLTVHSTMSSSPVSDSQLRDTLKQKLFPARSFAA